MSLEIVTLKEQLKVAKKKAETRFFKVAGDKEFWGVGGGPLDFSLGEMVHRDYRLVEYMKVFKDAGKEGVLSYLASLNFFSYLMNREKVEAANNSLSGVALEKLNESYDSFFAFKNRRF